jgi:hypothetical protein
VVTSTNTAAAALLLQQQQAAAQQAAAAAQAQQQSMQQLQSWLAMAQAAAQHVASLTATTTIPGNVSVGIVPTTLLGGGMPMNNNKSSVGLNDVPTTVGGIMGGGLTTLPVVVPNNPIMTVVGLPNLLGLGGTTTTTTIPPMSLGLENNNNTTSNNSGTTTTSTTSIMGSSIDAAAAATTSGSSSTTPEKRYISL